jgi:hypothetical protein
MPEVLKRFFSSRKFWSFAVGLVTLVSASLEDGTISGQEAQAISALVIGYIFSVAWEDGKQAEAIATVAAKENAPAVGIDANSVQVTPPADSAPPQPRHIGPFIDTTGLR